MKHYRSFFLTLSMEIALEASRADLRQPPSYPSLIRERHAQAIDVWEPFQWAPSLPSYYHHCWILRKPICCLGFILHLNPNIVLTTFEGEQDSLLLLAAPEPGLRKKAKKWCSFVVHECMVHGVCLQSRLLDADMNGTRFPWSEHLLTQQLTTRYRAEILIVVNLFCYNFFNFIFVMVLFFLQPTEGELLDKVLEGILIRQEYVLIRNGTLMRMGV